VQLNIAGWTQFKSLVETKDLFIQYLDYGDRYFVFAADGPIIYFHDIYTDDPGNPDLVDFNDNFKDIANAPISLVIKEEHIPTGGHYQKKGCFLDVPAGSDHYIDIHFPHPVSLLAADYSTAAIHEGDQLAAIGSPDTVIGVTTSAHVIGDKTIDVSQTVVDNAFVGGFLKIGTEEYQRIESIDVDNLTVTFENGLVADQGASSVVKFEARLLDFVYIGPAAAWEVGKNKSGSSHLDPYQTVRLYYKNNEGSAKKFYVNLEYLY